MKKTSVLLKVTCFYWIKEMGEWGVNTMEQRPYVCSKSCIWKQLNLYVET